MTICNWKYPLDPVVPAPIVEVGGPLNYVVVRPVQYGKGYRRHAHRHRYGQLIYATKGLIVVKTLLGVWMIPSGRGVWIPPMQEHSVDFLSDTEMYNVHLDAEHSLELPKRCCTIQVPAVLKETAQYAATLTSSETDKFARAITMLIVRIISEAIVAPLTVPMPADKKLQRIYTALMSDPADNRSIEEWGGVVGLGARTLSRILKRETGMTFRAWRQQIRLLISIDKLCKGEPVTSIAFDVGYSDISTFITSFRRSFGNSPKAFFHYGTIKEDAD